MTFGFHGLKFLAGKTEAALIQEGAAKGKAPFRRSEIAARLG
jgi:hypothetical protein